SGGGCGRDVAGHACRIGKTSADGVFALACEFAAAGDEDRSGLHRDGELEAFRRALEEVHAVVAEVGSPQTGGGGHQVDDARGGRQGRVSDLLLLELVAHGEIGDGAVAVEGIPCEASLVESEGGGTGTNGRLSQDGVTGVVDDGGDPSGGGRLRNHHGVGDRLQRRAGGRNGGNDGAEVVSASGNQSDGHKNRSRLNQPYARTACIVRKKPHSVLFLLPS